MRRFVLTTPCTAAIAYSGRARRTSDVAGCGMAPWAGFEPTTHRLTADCSTIELPGKAPTGVARQRMVSNRLLYSQAGRRSHPRSPHVRTLVFTRARRRYTPPDSGTTRRSSDGRQVEQGGAVYREWICGPGPRRAIEHRRRRVRRRG